MKTAVQMKNTKSTRFLLAGIAQYFAGNPLCLLSGFAFKKHNECAKSGYLPMSSSIKKDFALKFFCLVNGHLCDSCTNIICICYSSLPLTAALCVITEMSTEDVEVIYASSSMGSSHIQSQTTGLSSSVLSKYGLQQLSRD